MAEQPSKLEVVRRAKEELGAADAETIAAHVEARFGMKIKPAIVRVLLASLRERETLEQNRRKARVELERLRAEEGENENPRKSKPGNKELKAPLKIEQG
jgi:hypothetical protein